MTAVMNRQVTAPGSQLCGGKRIFFLLVLTSALLCLLLVRLPTSLYVISAVWQNNSVFRKTSNFSVLQRAPSSNSSSPQISPGGKMEKFCLNLTQRLKAYAQNRTLQQGDSSRRQGERYKVAIGVSGRLGNQMFEYASTLGIARMNNMSACYPSSQLTRIFRLSLPRCSSTKGYKVVGERQSRSYSPRFENLPETNVQLSQYLQSWKYFHCYRDIILKEFAFLPSVKQSALNILQNVRTSPRTPVRIGVQVRRGDLLLTSEKRKGFVIPPTSYINKAATYMRKKYGDVIFFIVSEDPDWCKRYLVAKDFIIVSRNSAGVHMAVLASCDHVIMTLGTYGWWGGYLAGGDVIYYNKSTVAGSHADRVTNEDDFYLPDWIPLDD